jgi:hypothetical protein
MLRFGNIFDLRLRLYIGGEVFYTRWLVCHQYVSKSMHKRSHGCQSAIVIGQQLHKPGCLSPHFTQSDPNSSVSQTARLIFLRPEPAVA